MASSRTKKLNYFSYLFVVILFSAAIFLYFQSNSSNVGFAAIPSIRPSVTTAVPNPVIASTIIVANQFVVNLVICGNLSCTGGNVTANLGAGEDAKVVIAPDRLPFVIAHNNQYLYAIKCRNYTCTNFTKTTIHDTGQPNKPISDFKEVKIGSDNLPVIAFSTLQNDVEDTRFLRVIKCNNASCTNFIENVIDAPNPLADEGFHLSMAIGSNGFPILSYSERPCGAFIYSCQQNVPFKLKTVLCNNLDCSLSTKQVVDSPNVWPFNNVQIGGNGLPLFAYTDHSTFNLRVANCQNTQCNSHNIYTHQSGVKYLHSAIPADQKPIFSFYDSQNASLSVFKCADMTCTSGNTQLIDSGVGIALNNSIAIGRDGKPIIAYATPYSGTSSTLKVATCSNVNCSTFTISPSIGAVNAMRYVSIAT